MNADEEDQLLQMERQRLKLVEIIDSEFGLLNLLLSDRVLSYGQIESIKTEKTRYKKNEKLLDYIILNGKHQGLMTTLTKSAQVHIVNWIIGDGEYRIEFGLDWPLGEKENEILDYNQATLVDILDTSELMNRLLSQEVINMWQKEFIEARTTNHDKNEALLDIVRRLSRRAYCKLIKCLRITNQDHIADVLENGGIIVPVHATLENDNLDETETRIVNEMTTVLCRSTTSVEQVHRLLAALQLQVIAVKRGESIVLYVICFKEKELGRLCKVVDNLEMKAIIDKLFGVLLPKLVIRVITVAIFEQDLLKAKDIFARAKSIRLPMEHQKDKLVEIIDPEVGLLKGLLKDEVLSLSEVERITQEQTKRKKNATLLDYIFKNHKHQDLMAALKDSHQTHVVNWILGDGKYENEFGKDWPLTDKEIATLDDNQAILLEILNTRDLPKSMYSEQVINIWQKGLIESGTSNQFRNGALLDIVRRLSRKGYYQMMNSLRESNQEYIADVLENGGVIVRVHATLVGEDLDATEAQIASEMTDLLSSSCASMEREKAMLAELQLNLVAVRQGGSIVLYVGCSKETHLNRLCDVVEHTETKRILEGIFNLIVHNKPTIRVQALKISGDDFRKAKKVFPRSTKEMHSFAIVVGLDEGPSISRDVLKINLSRPDDVSRLRPVPATMHMLTAAAVDRNSIYVIGLGPDYNEIWKLDGTYYKWIKCASLVQGRRRHSSAFVEKVLYICGGNSKSSKTILDDVEAFDTVDDTCASVGKMVCAVESMGNCVAFKTSLYIFGGYDTSYKAVSIVQVYNTKLNSCTTLSKPMPRAHALLRAVPWENSVILLHPSDCFIYDIDAGTWKERDRFKTDIRHFGMTVSDGRIFIFGGGRKTFSEGVGETWVCRDDVRSIPIVNILNDEPTEWRHHAKLPKPLLVHAFGKMDLLV